MIDCCGFFSCKSLTTNLCVSFLFLVQLYTITHSYTYCVQVQPSTLTAMQYCIVIKVKSWRQIANVQFRDHHTDACMMLTKLSKQWGKQPKSKHCFVRCACNLQKKEKLSKILSYLWVLFYLRIYLLTCNGR